MFNEMPIFNFGQLPNMSDLTQIHDAANSKWAADIGEMFQLQILVCQWSDMSMGRRIGAGHADEAWPHLRQVANNDLRTHGSQMRH
ncbi:MAG: hypothetical protein M9890_04095 [Thermomicrobiales bacterium]|nr:hypothetical protein [Thermomicrobiales bacterium]